MITPIKTISNKRLAYLDSLSEAYKEMGYKTLLNGFENVLMVFDKSVKDEELRISKQEQNLKRYLEI